MTATEQAQKLAEVTRERDAANTALMEARAEIESLRADYQRTVAAYKARLIAEYGRRRNLAEVPNG